MSNVNSEQVMSKIRAEISDDTVAPDEPLDNGCLFHRGIDVAEIMRKIKHEAMFDRLLPDSADCSRNAENEISRRLEDICGEVERINNFIENTRVSAEENMHPGRVIPVRNSRPAIIRKLFTLIKRCVRKATHFLMLDQIAYNQKMDACVKALSESQEQVLRLADVVGLLAAEQKNSSHCRKKPIMWSCKKWRRIMIYLYRDCGKSTMVHCRNYSKNMMRRCRNC